VAPCACTQLRVTAERRTHPPPAGRAQLSRRAQLARLLAASWGAARVTEQHWAEARALEQARLARTRICVTSVKTG